MNPFQKLGEGLRHLAPSIATALGGVVGGPVGAAVAKTALAIVGGKLGLDEKAAQDPDVVEAALSSASPQQLASIRAADNEFRLKMREHDLEEERIHSGDRASARQMQIQTASRMPGVVGIGIFVGFFTMIGLLFFTEPKGHALTILNILVGSLGTMVVQVANFFFGSTKRDESQTELIAKMQM